MDREKKQTEQARPAPVFNVGTTLRYYKRVLITGGAGFIGSHICDRMIKEGCEVICVDNLHSGSRSNIQHLVGNPMFEFRLHDVIEPLHLNVDRIYHLACPASPVFYQKDGIYTLKTLFIGTMNMLQLAKETGARLLISSTSEVYGDPKVHPQKEDYWGNVNPIGIRSCYDEGKRVAETLCIEFERAGAFVRIARIFNTYGERMLENDGRVISNFATQALNGKQLTIYGDGSQTRSFCYVSDTVEGLTRLMESDAIGPVNIGNPVEYTIKELAEKVTKYIGGDAGPPVYMPLPSDDPVKRKPDITRAKTLLDWEPTIALDDGLKRTIDYFKEHAKVLKEHGSWSGGSSRGAQLPTSPLAAGSAGRGKHGRTGAGEGEGIVEGGDELLTGSPGIGGPQVPPQKDMYIFFCVILLVLFVFYTKIFLAQPAAAAVSSDPTNLNPKS